MMREGEKLNTIKLGSLFDGIAGFPLSASEVGIIPVWASEIEPFPIKVSQHHFPFMKHLGDITKINGAEIEPVDVITFGSPCQDLSVAGKREGLDGERSGLFLEAIRIVREMQDSTGGEYPRFLIWENVPGAFSSNQGADIQVVLDEFEKLGFVVDMNVLDAQFMGVPQRRRRIFALCVSASYIRQMKTPISFGIITQLLTEVLLCILSEQLNLYEEGPKNSVWKQRKLTVDGLQKKMKLFSTEAKRDFEILLTSWIDICRTYLNEQSLLGNRSEKSSITTKADISKSESLMGMENEELFGDTLKSWKQLLDVLYCQGNSCITLTATSEIMNQIIYGCAILLENMALLIARLKDCCQNSYETALYILTAREVCISYARERQTGFTLFSELERIPCWDDYIRLHTQTGQFFERYFGGRCASEILFKPESLRGNIAESRKARQEAAATVGDGIEESNCLTPWDVQSRRIHDVNGKWPSLYGGEGGGHGYVAQCVTTGTGRRYDPETETLIPVALSGDKIRTLTHRADSSPCVDRGQDVVFIPQLYDMTHANDVIRPVQPGISPTLNHRMGTGGNQVPILPYPDPANTLLAKANMSFRGDSDNVVSLGYRVRRLTPLECERLQGLPDGWTDIPGSSDTARYKAIGNGMAKPCVDYVMSGIAEVLKAGDT